MVYLNLRGQGLPRSIGEIPIKAVLFDKDGTMSRSEPMLTALAESRILHCLEQTLGSTVHGRSEELKDLLHRAYGLIPNHGLHPSGLTAVAAKDHNLISTATALAQVGLDWPEALAIAEKVFAITDLLHEAESIPKPEPTQGLIKLLRELRSHDVLCAVISNDHEQGIKTFVDQHELGSLIQGIWSADHRPRKPDPGAVHGLCQWLGVYPSECALIGDANSDLYMAKAAGVGVILGYCSGWRQPLVLDASFPHLQHWDQLIMAPEA
jgi:phosphoglycolate phosphatase